MEPPVAEAIQKSIEARSGTDTETEPDDEHAGSYEAPRAGQQLVGTPNAIGPASPPRERAARPELRRLPFMQARLRY